MDQQQPNKQIHEKLQETMHSMAMVYNPTEKDHVVSFGKAGIHFYAHGFGQTGDTVKHFLVPNRNKDTGYGNGKLEVPFHIALKYDKEMTDKRRNHIVDSLMRVHRNKWKRDQSEFPTWWENNWRAIVQKDQDMSFDELADKYRKEHILGITKKYSTYTPPPVTPVADKGTAESVLDTFKNLPEYTAEDTQTIEDNKQSFIQEVSQ